MANFLHWLFQKFCVDAHVFYLILSFVLYVVGFSTNFWVVGNDFNSGLWSSENITIIHQSDVILNNGPLNINDQPSESLCIFTK